MFEVGRVCLKIAGRDANQYCVIVKKVDDTFVMVDGQTRRKKVNIKHIEPTQATVDIKEDADHEAVKKALAEKNIEVKDAKKSTKTPKKE